ncbi:EamA family transporter [Salininema proteolyticum]|uniref:DMT family transporter n=1 Tax=Salininema proteolyticum TaxID=1607685 RepID=A0ABV8TT70_9ACTN
MTDPLTKTPAAGSASAAPDPTLDSPNRPASGGVAGIALVLGGAFSVQFGSAVAALAFPLAGALGVVALRISIAAVLLLAVCRPRLRDYSRADLGVAAAFGLALGGMNVFFYLAIERIPMGLAVTLEVLGPLVLSVVIARRALSLLWAGLALAGVFLLGRGGLEEINLAGAAFALCAASMWAAYIVLSSKAGERFPRLDGLALAMVVSMLVSLPLGIGSAGTALLDPVVLGLGAAVAILSSGLPYALELLALRRLPKSTFSILMSLAPAIAALAGFLVLGQTLTLLQCLAIGLVIVASAGAVRTGRAAKS